MKKSSRQRLLTSFFGDRGVNFLVKIKRKFGAVIEFYCEVLKSKINTGASLRLVFFPFNGGMFGSSRVPYPAEIWESYIWIDKICRYGASASWNENIVTLDYMDTKISANVLDSSIETGSAFRSHQYSLKSEGHQ